MAHDMIDMILSRIHGDDQASAQRDPGGARTETLQGVRQRMARDFTTLKEKAEKIRTDPSRSPIGVRQAVSELSTKLDLSYLDAVKATTEDDLQRYRMLLFTIPKSDRDPTLAFLHEQEVRLAYKDAAPYVRMEAFRKAIQDGQHEIARALVSGPLGSLISAEYQQDVLQEHAQRSQPAVYESFEQATNLKEHLDSLHTHATQVLTALKDESPAPAMAVR